MNPFIETTKWLIWESIRFISPPPVAIEWVMAAFGALLIAVLPLWDRRSFFSRLSSRIRGLFHRLANRRRTAILICGLLPVAIRLSLLGVMPVPEPSIHDEFSHLLLGDTLAHGRLANPVHPMWQHFESIHIIQQPTYSSMYPPAQGWFLALGEVLFHEPWAGVVISVGLMSMAVCWMMQGWLPPAWAFYGSLLMALKIGIFGLWMDTYIGGAAGSIGGALLIGALPRLRRGGRQAWPAALCGLGMVILMNSRPFDGALLSVAALLYLAPTLFRQKRLITALAPTAIVLACGALWTGYYNWRVTGNPTRMAYQVNRDTYGWPENLAFLPPKKIALRDPVLEKMYLKEIGRREVYHHPDKLADDYLTRWFDTWTYFIGPLLTAPLLFLPWIFRERRTRPLVLFAAVIAALNLFQLVLYPYHLAPLVAVIFAILTQGVRHIYVRLNTTSLFLAGRPLLNSRGSVASALMSRDREGADAHSLMTPCLGHARGAVFALLLPIGLLAIDTVKQNAGDLNLGLAYWERASEWHRDTRAYITEWLSRRPGKQLVVVRYSRFHDPNQEWVYNGADIDGSKIVWAREVDPQSDAALLRYFHDREVWLLKADVYPQRVVKYSAAEAEPLPNATETSSLAR